MKLSLAWVFDHLQSNWRNLNVADFIQSFIKATAEIESYDHINCPIDSWYVASVTDIEVEHIKVMISELDRVERLPKRPEVQIGNHYLVKKEADLFLWVSMQDIGSEKEGLLAPFAMPSNLLLGQWRDYFEKEDVVFDVDNKSINHRPDLWGHRGIARELSTLYKIKLVDESQLLAQHEIIQADGQKIKVNSITIENKAPKLCSRFAVTHIAGVSNYLSDLFMVIRLARASIKSIDAIVDLTNYTMLDWGHPLHAFDGSKIADHHLILRTAQNKEELLLLDNTKIELTQNDIVVADTQHALSLAGIMGGKSSAISLNSTSIVLEAGCFDAPTIRNSALHYAKRTESSARFEKSLNPAMVEKALLRYLKLLQDRAIAFTHECPIAVIGILPALEIVHVPHALIEKSLGIQLAPEFILNTLQSLGFQAKRENDTYTIEIPHDRAQDIAIPQDIVEEVGRFYGYENISAVFPTRHTKPFNISSALRTRAIKEHLSYGLSMREVMTYAFFDESFLKKLQWEPGKTLQVKEAVSENWRRLVTSLVPNLFNVLANANDQVDALNMYEIAAVWPYSETGAQEGFSLTGAFADFKNTVDFYTAKEKLQTLFQMLNLAIEWKKTQTNLEPWFMPYQVADLFHENQYIGRAGKINPLFYNKVIQGDAFVFELDAHYLIKYQAPIKRFKAASKYPRIRRDVTFLIDEKYQVQSLIDLVGKIDKRINHIDLINIFSRPEWVEQKAVTLRIVLEDYIKTMTTQEIDDLITIIGKELNIKMGAQIK